MAYQSPWQYRRPERRMEERVLEDPQQPELRLTLKLQVMGAPERLRAAALGAGYVQQYIDNGEPLPLPDGSVARFEAADSSLLHDIAMLQSMQVVGEGEMRITLADWYGWALVAPTLFLTAVAFAGELQGSDGEAAKNSGPAPTVTSSPQSPAAAGDTQN